MKRVFHHLGSLRLTVALLVCSMLIVFFGTLDQVDWGVGTVQKHYFESLIVAYPISPHSWANWAVLGPVGPGLANLGFRLPMPGGFLVGGLLLINLVAAHFRYFKPGWKRTGIAITHAGVLLLVVAGFATAYFQRESMTSIPEGAAADWAEDFVKHEIVLTDMSDPAKDRVTVVPEDLIRDKTSGGVYDVPGTTLRIRVHTYWANGGIVMPFQASQFPGIEPVRVDHGVAAQMPLRIVARPEQFSQNAANTPVAVVEIADRDRSLGTWLIAAPQGPPMLTKLFAPQPFAYDGRSCAIALRPARTYFPFALRLNTFTHDVYAGTDIPKNFASDITLADPREAAPRDVTISMNKPLRHGGYTFYQASFFPDPETGRMTTRLQTVRNPSYLLPYLAVFLVGAGMLVQFGITLAGFIAGKTTGTAR